MAQEYPTLNGVAPSWSDIAVTFPIYGGATVKLVDITALKWSDNVDMGEVYGANGGKKTRRTTGKYKCDASVTFLTDALLEFQTNLAQMNPRISLVGFDIQVLYTPPGRSDIITVDILGCRMSGRSGDHKDSTDADVIEVPINPMEILVNGIRLF